MNYTDAPLSALLLVGLLTPRIRCSPNRRYSFHRLDTLTPYICNIALRVLRLFQDWFGQSDQMSLLFTGIPL